MKTNPLLVNMKGKISVIDGAIGMIYRLQKGETIKFGEHVEGALKYSVTTKEEHRASLNETLIKLFNERENLQKQVNNF